ncbi:hypothetical protein [Acidianus sp. HS-5]|uniref:hypothetical protein n=1 Tax=Acidianus sp. HS-5 TaxID=2886040 RepID=UPI001F43AB08|nr:hypothetical protein [Acidianus sp. HS-5]BDC17650.1 hypothetical protein HS5_05400 [Acidianus sp. HS-5]
MNIKILTSLLVLTLVLNVVLGFELYEALHPSHVSSVTPNVKTYSFSFSTKYKFHVKKLGEYILQLKVQEGIFSQLYVIIYFKHGETITLSLNNTNASVYFKHKEENAVAYISGESYSNLSKEQILNNIKLCVIES